MSLFLVCALVGMAITVNCVAVYWLVRSYNAKGIRRPRYRKLERRSQSRETIRSLYRQAGYDSPVLVLYLIITTLIGLGLWTGKALRMPMLVWGPAVVFMSFAVPVLHLRIRSYQRQQAFGQQLPGALELMANGLRAGLGINSVFEVVAKEMPNPLGGEFSQMVATMNLGGASIEQALLQLVERNPSIDIRLFSQALLIHKQVGGNLAEVLDNLDRTIRDRMWLQRELRAATAEQRISGWVLSLMPVAVAAILFIVNPDYVMMLVKTLAGRYLLAIAAVLETAGILSLRHILNSIEF